jgi:hypothetical protein
VRVWTTRTASSEIDGQDNVAHAEQQGTARPSRRRLRRYPSEALVFDTETEPGPSQRLRFLVWRVYRDRADAPPGHLCVEEGIAFADDLPERDPDGFRLLTEHVRDREAEVGAGFSRPGAGRRVVCEPVSWWMQERLYLYGYQHRDRCAVVGFNLPFDLGRLASYWTKALGYYRGGWSLGLWGSFDEQGRWKDLRFHPRLLLKAIDPRRTLFSWGSVKRGDEDGRGKQARFIDLRTLAFALTDNSYTLEGACAAFGDRFAKDPVSFESITTKLIDYAFEDVAHTSLPGCGRLRRRDLGARKGRGASVLLAFRLALASDAKAVAAEWSPSPMNAAPQRSPRPVVWDVIRRITSETADAPRSRSRRRATAG